MNSARLIICAIALALIANAFGDPSKEKNPLQGKSIAHVIEVLKVAQEPWVSSEDRKKTAQWGLEYLRTATAKKLNVPVAKITGEFSKDPSLIEKFSASDPNGLGELYTQFSVLDNSITAEGILSKCSSQSITKTDVRNGISAYCPSDEGSTIHQVFLWQGKTDGKVSTYRIPNFAYSDNLNQILSVAAFASVESARKSDGFLRPNLATIKKSSGVSDENELRALMAMSDLRADAFERSLVGSLKTVLELRYSFSKKPLTDDDLKALSLSKAREMCPACPSERISRIASQAKTSIAIQENSLRTVGKSLYLGQEKALRGICDRLFATRDSRGKAFYFGHPASQVSKNHLTPLNLMIGPGAIEMKNAWESRKEILKKVVSQGREGVLLLTNALTQYEAEPGEKNTEISDQQIDPGNVNFKCTTPLDPLDVDKIQSAIEEADQYATDFGVKTAENLRAEKFDRSSLLKDLKALMKTNPRAVGEALGRSGSLAPFVCEAMHSIDSDDERKRIGNKLKIWGSLVVGTALTLTGVLAPAGSALCATAMLTGVALGVVTGTSELIAAQYAQIEAELYRDAAVAQGGNLSRLRVSKEQLDLYAKEKFSGILNLGLSAVDAGVLAMRRAFPKAGIIGDEVSPNPNVGSTRPHEPVQPRADSKGKLGEGDGGTVAISGQNSLPSQSLRKSEIPFSVPQGHSVSFIGEGGHARVYKVIASDGNAYVVKHYSHTGIMEDDVKRLQILNENLKIDSHGSFQVVGVKKVYGNDVTLQYVEGTDLNKRLISPNISGDEKVKLLRNYDNANEGLINSLKKKYGEVTVSTSLDPASGANWYFISFFDRTTFTAHRFNIKPENVILDGTSGGMTIIDPF